MFSKMRSSSSRVYQFRAPNSLSLIQMLGEARFWLLAAPEKLEKTVVVSGF
jgi:hypothetical protein